MRRSRLLGLELDEETRAALGFPDLWEAIERVLYEWQRRKAARDVPRLKEWLQTPEGLAAIARHQARKKARATPEQRKAKSQRAWARTKADPAKLEARRAKMREYMKTYRKKDRT